MLLFLDGSGDAPLFRYKIDTAHKCRMIYTSFNLNYDSLSSIFHVVFISKPGINLVDSFFVPSLDSNIDIPSVPEYNQRLTAGWRAEAASLVVDYVSRNLKTDTRKIVVMGVSEGALVAPHVAVLNKKVTHVVCFSGNGLNQFYDFIIRERIKVAKGEVTDSEAQVNIDTLMSIFKNIYSHPKTTDQYWLGHTYQRWASFCERDPLAYMLQLNIPIYIAHGTADDNTQILTADYIPLEFLKHGKTNLTYRVYPAYNHFLQRVYKGKPPTEHSDEAFAEMLTWLSKWSDTPGCDKKNSLPKSREPFYNK